MEHTEPPIVQDPPQGTVDEAEERFERPDQRGPRGNPEVEAVDVERGQGKIRRVLGW
jgi:hypothetical protein